MEFAGLQKLTLLDYPGRTACTLFTWGCPFRCPFCHNAHLLEDGAAQGNEDALSADDALAFLKKRRGLLEGVCVTGGEPLAQPELFGFLARVKDIGYLVKLDTNGYYPERLRAAAEWGLVDCVAMDIKNAPARYAQTVGLARFDLSPVCESAAFLMRGKLPFEFRTTLVRELHAEADMPAIGQWLRGSEPYFLQAFVDSPQVLARGLHAFDKADMERMRALLLPYLPNAALRGV